MKKKHNIIFLLMLFLTLTLTISVSAEGLEVTPSQESVNHTLGEETKINFTVTNTHEEIDFQNISFVDNDYIEMEEIGKLVSGENKTFQANIIAEEDYNDEIRLKGYYNGSRGEEGKEHVVDVDYAEGSDGGLNINECDLEIIEGSSVTWRNLDTEYGNEHIKMMGDEEDKKFEDRSNEIDAGENGTLTFNKPQKFKYHFLSELNEKSNDCSINVKSSTGLITQNKYDGNVSLDINVNYPPTELKVDRGFRKNYTFDPEKQYNSEKSNYDWIKGFFGIENIGNNTAYGVKIGVEGVDENWIDSDTNDFKLNQDSIKDIYPELKPQIYSTNKTNQTYNLNITIKGKNTPEIKREVNVYVPYDEIEGEDFDDGKSPIERILEDRFDLEEFLEFCEQNPDHEACGGSDRFLVKDSEDDSFNVTYYKSQVDRFNRMFVNEIRKDNKNTNILKEEVQDMKGWQNTSDEESSEIKSLLEETLEQNNKWMSFIQFLTILIISLIAFGILGVVIWMLRKKNKLPSFKIAREWQKIKNKNK